jgi:hypothetical protein
MIIMMIINIKTVIVFFSGLVRSALWVWPDVTSNMTSHVESVATQVAMGMPHRGRYCHLATELKVLAPLSRGCLKSNRDSDEVTDILYDIPT